MYIFCLGAVLKLQSILDSNKFTHYRFRVESLLISSHPQLVATLSY